ncbi:unnamed protein product, partial [Callosobruchus maculatus]
MVSACLCYPDIQSSLADIFHSRRIAKLAGRNQ